MSVVISVSDEGEDFFLSNWAFDQVLQRVVQRPDVDADTRYRFEQAGALNGLLLEIMPDDVQRHAASILIDTALAMAPELEPGDPVFTTGLRDLVTFLERVYGPRPVAPPNGAQAGR